MKAFRASFEH